MKESKKNERERRRDGSEGMKRDSKQNYQVYLEFMKCLYLRRMQNLLALTNEI